MRPQTWILYSLSDRITGQARGARQKDTVRTSQGLCRDIKGSALDWWSLPGPGLWWRSGLQGSPDRCPGWFEWSHCCRNVLAVPSNGNISSIRSHVSRRSPNSAAGESERDEDAEESCCAVRVAGVSLSGG